MSAGGKVGAYYNENDPKAAAWLRELIKRGLIADGEVDTRSIVDVAANDVRGFTQCHWFAGIGAWSYGLRIAGWPDDREIWTGSCPCQPFSAAGKRQGKDDARHLWPELYRLIQERRPVIWFGEQVASPDGLAWLDAVLTDLESASYAAGAVDICAAGFGAPHIRQRLWIVAESGSQRCDGKPVRLFSGQPRQASVETARNGSTGRLADADGRHTSAEREQRGREHGQQPEDRGAGDGMVNASGARREGHGLQPIWGSGDREGADMRLAGSGSTGERLGNAPRGGRGEFGNAPQPGSGRHSDGADQLGGVTLGDTERAGLEGLARHGDDGAGWPQQVGSVAAPGITGGVWADADLIWCRDRKWRPIESRHVEVADGAAPGVVRVRDGGARSIEDEARETFPLIKGARARTMRLRGYGNAVTSANVAEFVAATMTGEHRRTE